MKHDLYSTTHMFTEFCDALKEGEPGSFETLLAIAVVLPLGLIIYCLLQQDWDKLIWFAVIAAVVIAGYHLIKFISAKCLTASMTPHKKELAELNEQYEAKNAEAKQSLTGYKALVQEFMDMDPVKASKEE
jgi:hypothetical protein